MLRLVLVLAVASALVAPPAVTRRRVWFAEPLAEPIDQDGADGMGTFRYDNSESISPLEKRKALEDTANWCLERCIKLGHCEVFEDLNKMTTAQVQDFCKACVLTGESTNDECDVSMMFQDDAPWAGKQPDDLVVN
mmetsp:Transcript_10044/g.25529  ORF Transcript_10044/g.25529 Transcript_10044/m.25529 type:complete len:136 (-) Transcript_10044:197-604(-)